MRRLRSGREETSSLLRVYAEFQLQFRSPPSDQHDKWAGRPVRNFAVVHPPLPPNTDPSLAYRDQEQFVKNVWTAQALMRTKPIASAPKGSMQSQGVGLPKAYRGTQNHIVEIHGRNREAVVLYANVWPKNSWLGSHIKVRE